MLKKVTSILPLALLTVPVFASAQDVESIIRLLTRLISYVLPLIMALALLWFFWGLAKYISAAGDEDAQKGARSMMIWGVIILFVMASVWGLVRILTNTFDLTNTPITPPGIPAANTSGVR